jgi:hypothetical protein
MVSASSFTTSSTQFTGRGGRYIAYVPDEGFGNRMRGAWSTLLLSMLLDRTFLVHWTEPCHWSLQLAETLPWDWDATHYPRLMELLTKVSGVTARVGRGVEVWHRCLWR